MGFAVFVRYAGYAAFGLLLAACQSVQPIQNDPSADLVIRNVTVVDSASGARSSRTVVVNDGLISAVLTQDQTEPSARQRLDGTGKFLIPGLWDMHVHITYEPEISEAMPALFLSYGITSVRDTGGLLSNMQAQLPRWRAPDAVAPRLFYSGPLLDGAKVVYNGDGRPEIGISNPDVAAATANIARLKAAGVDFVKVYELVDPTVFAALVAAARAANLPIASHVPLAVGASVAGPKVDSMEHLRNVELACAADAPERLAERLAKVTQAKDISGYDLRRSLHGEYHDAARNNISERNCDSVIAGLLSTIQVPTLRLNTIPRFQPYDRSDWLAHVARLPESVQRRWAETAARYAKANPGRSKSTADWSLSLVKRLHNAGVPIGAGTDTPIGSALPGYSLHTELERLVEAGLSPADALHSATVRGAEFFGLGNGMGNIAAGQAADLVLLTANPLVDIRNTRTVSKVISRGKLVYSGEN